MRAFLSGFVFSSLIFGGYAPDNHRFWPLGCGPRYMRYPRTLQDECIQKLTEAGYGTLCQTKPLPCYGLHDPISTNGMACCGDVAAARALQQTQLSYLRQKVRYDGDDAMKSKLLSETIIKYETIDGEAHKMYAIKLKRQALSDDHNVLNLNILREHQLDGHGATAQVEVDDGWMRNAAMNYHGTGPDAVDYLWDGRVDSRVTLSDLSDAHLDQIRNAAKPYGRVAVISFAKYTKFGVCSGTVLSRTFVMTALHCVYQKDPISGRVQSKVIPPPESIEVFVGFDKEVANHHNSMGFRPTDDLFDTANRKRMVKAIYMTYGAIDLYEQGGAGHDIGGFDIALLELTEALPVNVGHLAFGSYPDATIQQWVDNEADNMITIGFPADKESEAYRGGSLSFKKEWRMHRGFVMGRGTVSQITMDVDAHAYSATAVNVPAAGMEYNRFIDRKYKCYNGQSGSGIFHFKTTADHQQYVLIGVLSGGRLKPERGKFDHSWYARISSLRASVWNDVIGGTTTFIEAPVELVADQDAHGHLSYFNDYIDYDGYNDDRDDIRNNDDGYNEHINHAQNVLFSPHLKYIEYAQYFVFIVAGIILFIFYGAVSCICGCGIHKAYIQILSPFQYQEVDPEICDSN